MYIYIYIYLEEQAYIYISVCVHVSTRVLGMDPRQTMATSTCEQNQQRYGPPLTDWMARVWSDFRYYLACTLGGSSGTRWALCRVGSASSCRRFLKDIFYLGTNEEKVKLRKAMKDIQEIPPQSHSIRVEHGHGAGGLCRWYHFRRL